MIIPTTKTETKKFNPFQQFFVELQEFDAYDKEQVIKQALGSQRGRSIMEVNELRSVNFAERLRGWRLTPLGIELNSFDIPDGSITFAAIQDIATARLLGRSTAGTGSIELLTVGTGLQLSAGVLSATITQYTAEQAQDDIGGILADTDTVDLTYTDATPEIKADVRKQMSITSDASGVKLSGDAATPGNSKYYGTDKAGSKGFTVLPYLPLFDHFIDVGNVGTGEDDLYSDTLAAAQLANNGEKIEAEYGGVFVSSATATRQLKIYFGGTMIFDSGALTLSLSSAWTAYVTIIRVSSSVVRTMISLTTEGAALAAYTAYTEVTGLTLANAQILKITGEAAGVGAATDDIVAKMAAISWEAAA